MGATVLKNPQIGYENIFAGNYDVIPEDRIQVSEDNYERIFIKDTWDGEQFIEGATPEEIAEQNRIKIPEVISAMDLKLQLFELGITDQDIFEDIDSIPDVMFPPSEKQKAKIKYQSAAKFERYNADLNLVATMEGISQEQLDQIFINGNSR